MGVKYGLPLIAPRDARLFVLGSLPGDASLGARQYYAHPTNQFWRLLGAAIGEDIAALDYDPRLDCLARHRIGLWDVIGSARRPGSLDQAIRGADHNQIAHLLVDFPQLKAIAFNGKQAGRIGHRMIGAPSAVTLIDLPSSSAANTLRFEEKCASWRQLGRFAAAPAPFACAARASRHD